MWDAFTALVWLLMTVSQVAAVPPPRDVEVSCHNQQVKVHWNYTQPGAVFTVTVVGDQIYKPMETTGERHCDLTRFIWASEERYMGNYYVEVSAAAGGHRSKPATSSTFTFNNVKTATTRCLLELPPVQLLKKNQGTTVQFRNPFHFYKELEHAPKKAIFLSTFTSDAGHKVNLFCGVANETCRHHLQFADDEEECGVLKGFLFDENNISHVSFNKSERVCAVTVAADPSQTPWIATGAFLAVVAALVTIVIVVVAVVRRLWSKAPRVIIGPFQDNTRALDTSDSSLDICIVRPVTTEPLLFSDERQDGGDRACLTDASSSSHLASTSAERPGAGDDSSEKTESVSVDSWEPGSGYDSRHFPVELGNGDTAMGYNK